MSDQYNDQENSTDFNINNLLNIGKENTTQTAPNYLMNSLAIDQVTTNENMKVLKAAIPFFEHNLQKQIAVLVKLLELKNTFSLYDSEEVKDIQQLNLSNTNKEVMLQNIREVCSDCNKNVVDIFLNMMNINKLFTNYQHQRETQTKEKSTKPNDHVSNDTPTISFNKNNTSNEQQETNNTSNQTQNSPNMNNAMIEGLKGMLSPEQRNMMDMFSTMMKMNNMTKNENKENDNHV
ncbi:hypothetical protein EDC19_2018 [Natranaerovirga hydrolytica]|uniref:Uncharacterized protein n=1 Tax=Natranaerovirga hydrolytica TaxID=680378 RepID=A0A4R1MLW6_9FIRM|nr:hypothetical protein [Natranaerovirga hydrolytica]TCK92862.1 hypothetical protein EDC19_2018 [Natranaerovirga hydrolytica]